MVRTLAYVYRDNRTLENIRNKVGNSPGKRRLGNILCKIVFEVGSRRQGFDQS